LANCETPPAALIALSIDFMGGNVQPKVASRQQLIVVRDSLTVQPMVVMSREQAKTQFSKNLADALDRNLDTPSGRGRTRWVSKEFGVSYEAARKWLGGLAIPDQTHIAIIAKRLKVDPAKLHAGPDVETARIGNDSFAQRLAAIWSSLSDEVKEQIIAYALVSAATSPPSAKKPSAQGRAIRA
jgi:hypothetical protein